MAESPKVRIALIGGGTIAPLHVKHLMSSPTCELVAIVDPYHPGRELASSLSLPHFESVASLLKALQKPPKAYVICVPSSLHVSIAIDVIYRARPKALLIEKPFCTDSKSGTELLALANEKGCKILVGHHRRFHPSLLTTRSVIETGKIGKITAISGLWTAKKDEGYFTSASWRATRSAGGGPIWTNFVHDIDALHFLTGARMTCVWAINTIPRRKHESVAADDIVEEGAAIMAQFSNGVVGTFLVSDNVASPYGWESATGDNPLYPKAEIQVDIYSILGTKGTIVVPDNTLWTYGSETTQVSPRGWVENSIDTRQASSRPGYFVSTSCRIKDIMRLTVVLLKSLELKTWLCGNLRFV
ncbi:Glucose-fructose oxidoreductase, bacterial [Penicillium roqueforti FM164]|uniref:Glucose-fructose oxidoreductase, bacterial n=1 Tax=Penicillium roqueforti (strain FM164) TaxID=1365484 RepID=W6PTW8_PENRF|nr:Glucose-fructose oxidoreductase, bacterial [Penicillium roqueforti FM164]